MNGIQVTEIRIDDDFDLDKIADSGQCFRWETKKDGTYRIIHGVHCVTVQPLGMDRYRFTCSPEEYRAVWHEYFDLGEDYRAVRGKINRIDDPFLYSACGYGQGIRILKQEPWETLISFIISQNKNIPAIRKSIELLCEAAGEERIDSQGQPYRVFPSPEAILALSNETLAACRLGYRCGYVMAAASDIAQGRLDLSALRKSSEETTMKELNRVYGVGPKVASCVSLFGLHHVNAFPVDVWIRRVLSQEYPGGYPAERYSPYNGIYQQYMFYYYRKKQIE